MSSGGMCVNFHKFMIRTIMNGNKTRVYEVYEMKFASLATNVHEHVMYIHEHAPLNRNFSRDKKKCRTCSGHWISLVTRFGRRDYLM